LLSSLSKAIKDSKCAEVILEYYVIFII